GAADVDHLGVGDEVVVLQLGLHRAAGLVPAAARVGRDDDLEAVDPAVGVTVGVGTGGQAEADRGGGGGEGGGGTAERHGGSSSSRTTSWGKPRTKVPGA